MKTESSSKMHSMLSEIDGFLKRQRKIYQIRRQGLVNTSLNSVKSERKPLKHQLPKESEKDFIEQEVSTTDTSIVSNKKELKKSSNYSEMKAKVNIFRSRKFQKPTNLTVEENRARSTQSEINSVKMLKFMDSQKVMEFVNSQIIGRNNLISTPFGQKLKVYCDYTASGQDVKFILDEVAKIEELYSNPHTEASHSGAYISHLLHEAETTIFRQLKASPKDYFIIDGGSGSTYGIEAAQKILGTYIPPKFKQYLSEAFDCEFGFEMLKDRLRKKGLLPLVVCTTYEHHSNEITWRQQLCDVIEVTFAPNGLLDLENLEEILKDNRAKGNKRIIASLSAGSNITGIKTDVEAVAYICKKYGVPSFFDYAAVGPYVPIDLSKKAEDGKTPLIDGIFLSPHKFLGGPGACGLLIMNKNLYDGQLPPTHGGGGTVVFVGPKVEDYYEDISAREKSGTPGVLQIIKCAFALELKGILQSAISEREHSYLAIFFERLSKNKNFVILGPNDPHSRVGIISFLIKMNGSSGEDVRYLHYGLVVRLLSDIFGIQARGGCFCAAMYMHYFFNIDQETSDNFRSHIVKDQAKGIPPMEVAKLGASRVSIHYSMSLEELEYLMFALEFLCEHGEKFLPLYTFRSTTAEWTHISDDRKLPRFELGHILGECRVYAKDEKSRVDLFEKQKEEAIALLSILPKSKGYDLISELGAFFKYCVERGNISDRRILEERVSFLQYDKKSIILC